MALDSDQPLSVLEGRRFSFFPAIRNVEHNEWTLENETWSEFLARNVHEGEEVWIPRGMLGEISSTDSPVLIVGLQRELEYKAGSVFPYRNPVVQMPSSPKVREAARAGTERPPPPSRASSTESQGLQLIGRALLIGLAVCLVFILFAFEGARRPFTALFREDSSTADQRYLALSRFDHYHDVTIKLGKPEREQWLGKEETELQFQALWYPSRSYVVILMGGTRSEVRYAGTLHDPSRKVLDSARLSGGGDTSSLMKNLPKF